MFTLDRIHLLKFLDLIYLSGLGTYAKSTTNSVIANINNLTNILSLKFIVNIIK